MCDLWENVSETPNTYILDMDVVPTKVDWRVATNVHG